MAGVGGETADGTNVGLSPGALDTAALRYALTGTLPYGKARVNNPKNDAAMNRAAELAAKAGLTPEDIATMPMQQKANASALMKDVAWQDGINRGQALIEGMFPIAEKYMKQIPLTEIQTINKGIVSGAKEFGSPAANNYANAMTTIALEYGRLVAGPQSAGMLPVEVVKLGMSRMSRPHAGSVRGRKGVDHQRGGQCPSGQ